MSDLQETKAHSRPAPAPRRRRDEVRDITIQEFIQKVPTKTAACIVEGFEEINSGGSVDGETLEEYTSMVGLVVGNLRPNVYPKSAYATEAIIAQTLFKLQDHLKTQANGKKSQLSTFLKLSETKDWPQEWLTPIV